MDREEQIAYDSLARVRIRNFQSIKELDIGLGRLTVLVGPSSSGKSAILRALRVLVRNAQSPSYVSYGETSFMIEAVFGDTTVSVERGKSKSNYRMDHVDYPKSGTSVPLDIQACLRMPQIGGLEISLGSQFDRPFLLAESGATAAKVLGELTNASLLLRASGEANRRRQGFSRMAGLREADVASIREQLAFAHGLTNERQRLSDARRWMNEARDLHGEVERLSYASEVMEVAQRAASLARSEAADVADVRPLLTQAEDVARQQADLQRLVAQYVAAQEASARLRREAAELENQQEQTRAESVSLLRKLGRCPMCGQSTKEAV